MKEINKSAFFKRQIALPEMGEMGQQKLQDAKVLVVGCGGLGSLVAVYLASAGIGNIHLVDFDTVDLSNLHRQVFYALEDVGKLKAEVLSTFIKKRAPFTKVSFSNMAITKQDVFKDISPYDIIVDGTDSLPTKYLLNDACVLKNKPLVYGSLYKFDGYVATFNVQQAANTFSGNLRDAFPEMATEVPNCSTTGTLNSIVGMIATQQVNEVLKLITGIGKPLTNQVLIYNSLQNTQLKMKLQTVDASQSERHKRVSEIFQNETYFDANCEFQQPNLLISAKDLKNNLLDKTGARPIVISLIENLKVPFCVDHIIPVRQLNIDGFQIDMCKKYVLVCQKGITSYHATKRLKERFPKATILSLAGGINDY
jgi:adenylyltransferase/sulfurtransferase